MKQAFPAILFFLPENDISSFEPFGTGNVNDTFLITLHTGQQLILQRINPSVFPEPQLVQQNIALVTRHLRTELEKETELKERFIPLTLFSSKRGYSYLEEDGSVWRMFNRIPGHTCETLSRSSQAEEIGRCMGIFHRLLSSLDRKKLVDTLPGFHHTPAYLEQYDRACHESSHNPDPDIKYMHRFIAARRSLATLLDNTAALTRCVIHGDPKVANFVFDDQGQKVVSLIDLDTVRDGLLLHDIGDALRSCCNTLGEDTANPKQVYFDPHMFSSWLWGYGAESEFLLTNQDKGHIVQAVRVIAFELGLRFITDHLEGNRYFKVSYAGHNLFRAKVQFSLIRSLEDQLEELQSIVDTIITIPDNS